MILARFLLRNMMKEKVVYPVSFNTKYNLAMNKTYEEAINCINSLQSNLTYIKNATNTSILPHSAIFSTTIAETQKYLLRTGISLDQLDKLSVIHVAGTKGKGSTCALCESIIRQYGYKTGFYSSPHLVAVRERIKLNGKPLSKEIFAENVFKIYNLLMEKRDHPTDMPGYFRFLTVVAFNIFLAEKVDVAILEVGIGGEYDCTNVVRNTPVVGITSLSIEHTELLGNSLEQIAWQKAGIMKNNSQVFTVEQPSDAMKVLLDRSVEKECSLEVAPNFDNYIWEGDKPTLNITENVQKQNASLAIQLSHSWLKKYGSINDVNTVNNSSIPDKTKLGLETCKWPGRYQIFKTGIHTFYLDGAHTAESLNICTKWFKNVSTSNNKALIFNITGNRDSEKFLQILSTINFSTIMFVPNIAASNVSILDQSNFINTNDMQIERCHQHRDMWLKIRNIHSDKQNTFVFLSVEDAVKNLSDNRPTDVLVTGSIHLVGAALTILDPELNTF